MNRPWVIGLAFGAALLTGLVAVTWLSRKLLELDRAQAEARAQAFVEEDVRLALWRMDSALSQIFAREGARPYFAYSPLYPAERAYTRMYAPLSRGEILIPSPLLAETPPFVKLHFQFGPDGEPSSPQAPVGNMRDVVEGQGFLTSAQVVAATGRLAAFAKSVTAEAIRAKLPAPTETPTAAPPTDLRAQNREWLEEDFTGPVQGPAAQKAQQVQRSNREFNARAGARGGYQTENSPSGGAQRRGQSAAAPTPEIPAQREAAATSGAPGAPPAVVDRPTGSARQAGLDPQVAFGVIPPPQDALANAEQARQQDWFFKGKGDVRFGDPDAEALNLLLVNPDGPAPRIVEGSLQPLWSGDLLLAARRVKVGDKEYIQGFQIDWEALRGWLCEGVVDLLPNARLDPLKSEETPDGRRLLASLPARLHAGASPKLELEGNSPLRLSLGAAWIGMALAVLAVGALLVGAVALGERRGAFVSSVTHELRTPLTTFRMYAEMLSEGMVSDERTKRKYLFTLRAEADRLAHLVENVLSYARLERGRDGGRVETVELGSLLDRAQGRFEQRVREAEMEWKREREDPLLRKCVRVDPLAFEQILFNLVDNACKYAGGSENRAIELSLRPGRKGKTVVLQVRDHGPGVARVSGVFKLFRKSAQEAANSAPGVGLGLALSRRLARRMGGELRHCHAAAAAPPGACFELELPVA